MTSDTPQRPRSAQEWLIANPEIHQHVDTLESWACRVTEKYAAYLLRELEREQREADLGASGPHALIADAVAKFRSRVLGDKA